MTLIVNLYAGPGAGKSTNAAGLFHRLKQAGVNAELVTEVAKDVVWEGAEVRLACQPWLFGEQLLRIERLMGKVEVIVTDSPLMLQPYYGWKYAPQYGPHFYNACVGIARDNFNTLDIFIERTKPYNPAGRIGDEASARQADIEIKEFVSDYVTLHSVLDGSGARDRLYGLTINRLDNVG